MHVSALSLEGSNWAQCHHYHYHYAIFPHPSGERISQLDLIGQWEAYSVISETQYGKGVGM